MRRRPRPDPVSPRALARLRSGAREGWVPTLDDLRPRDDAGRDGPEPAEPGGGGWIRAPSALVGAQWQPGRSAVLGVAVVTMLAVLVLGLRVAWAREDPGDVVAPGAGPAGVSAGAAPVGVPSSSTPASSVSPSPEAVGEVVVHVVGQVRRPGVLRLPAGSRVADAVEAAGGGTSRADLAVLNLARVLLDGEQVRVPRPGEAVIEPVGPPPAPGAGGAGAGPGGGSPVPLNTADVTALDTLPGIGPVLAQRIVDWRAEHGRFTSVDELGEVSGIGEKLLAQLRPLVTV